MALNTYAVGQRLTASLLQNLSDSLESYIPKTYTKSTSTARTSTTTYTIDPDLQLIPLEIGVYDIELLLFFTLANAGGATGPASLKTQWRFTGTWAGTNGPDRAVAGPNNTVAASPPNIKITSANFSANQASGQDAIYMADGIGTLFGSARETSMNVQVTAAGNLALYWAQNVSDSDATTIQGGTSFRVRKVL